MAVGLEWGSDGFDTAWCGFGLGLGKSETNAVFQTFSSSKATARFFLRLVAPRKCASSMFIMVHVLWFHPRCA